MENNQSQPRVIVDPARQVSGPSIGLLVTGIIGGLFSVLGLIAAIVGISVGSIAGLTSDWADDVPQIYSDIYEGGAAIGFMFIGILVAAFIIYASLKMKDLEQ